MKRLISIGFSAIVLLTLTANSVKAETKLERQIAANSSTQVSSQQGITAFKLVSLGYQGYFQNQGIPGYGRFVDASKKMDINAEDLVTAAVQANYISQDKLSDRSYIDDVKLQLRNLSLAS